MGVGPGWVMEPLPCCASTDVPPTSPTPAPHLPHSESPTPRVAGSCRSRPPGCAATTPAPCPAGTPWRSSWPAVAPAPAVAAPPVAPAAASCMQLTRPTSSRPLTNSRRVSRRRRRRRLRQLHQPEPAVLLQPLLALLQLQLRPPRAVWLPALWSRCCRARGACCSLSRASRGPWHRCVYACACVCV